MLEKKYELIKDGICIESQDKCREGLDELLESVEMILDEGHAEQELRIICTTYTPLGGIAFCEEVQDFDVTPREDEIDESMDGDFNSAMTSAGLGTDEDYGDEISPMGIWG